MIIRLPIFLPGIRLSSVKPMIAPINMADDSIAVRISSAFSLPAM